MRPRGSGGQRPQARAHLRRGPQERQARCREPRPPGTPRCSSALADRASRRGLASPPGDRPLARGAGRSEDQACQPRARDGQVLQCSPALKCSAEGFHRKVREHVPEALAVALDPALETIASLTERLRGNVRRLEALSRELYPETALLRQVGGVGPITALTFVLVLEDAARFGRSRSVGAYLGLASGQRQSGESDPQERISKRGEELLRKLLVQGAHYVLAPFAQDSDLRRHGLKIAERGAKNAKRRAAVAVARKLSVLLHRLWVTGEAYEPLYNARSTLGADPA